jgi:hypothetical protein
VQQKKPLSLWSFPPRAVSWSNVLNPDHLAVVYGYYWWDKNAVATLREVVEFG